ncbi:2,3-dihydroxybenzoate decarboxylase [Sphingomonas vulcanisoli]|uniref:2,3-dihydroxybenzoate decarboxylase n=1 Tax=Sphingomonas vulcanisoli TaxID=1658060 RepID=A0ABX0TRJ6_9SPHN|nr:amidohydrolase family protein [Sphingomonas vulcanisoli]NIJ08154.1 2,3-dihydroxybenzoate decarboxylase [Sphingomonas vulcanisoli]
MQNKIALEEHFATADTIGDSEPYFGRDVWPTKKAQLLDLQDERLRRMDACGIEVSIVSLNSPAVQARADAALAIDIARRANDQLAEQIARRPDRFRGFAALPLQDPEAATLELRRAVEELGFVGALVNGYSQTGSMDKAVYYDLPQFRPFWGEVERLDVPFYLHPRLPLASQQLATEGHPWLMGPAWQFSVETGTHALRLIGSGLFDEFPKLTVVLGHLGELLPFNIWRTSHWASADGRNPQGIPAKKSFVDYLRQNFYVTTSGNFRTLAMRNAMEEMGTARVLFSSDYPFEEMEEAATWFDAAEIGENDREAIGRDNARRLFKL